ncbi:ABC transporter ATP-binding protein [Plantactinospora sp. S1510]|uniref:ABC transporter ATP-binding protein n=1 Tax=Plantactinospora alkalitolerans TaxID=2789879 RepID=A0ABS0GU31_9ACTN|nr:ABC transporter ATP-binding protein [Plantactinospora alkalitolerans]MBF9129402.1 ABC transporter ATP-binding protein [Plantactinospora alkalitolerans]
MPPQLPHPHPGIPDTRGPLRYIWWLVRCQPWRVLRASLVGTAWMTGLSLRPYLISRAIDDGLRGRDNRALLFWVGAIVVAGIVMAQLGILRHRTMTFIREDATARSAAVLLRQLSRIGAVLPRKLAAGEVATVGGSDIGNTSHVLTMTGPGVGAVVAYSVVAVVLWSISPLLALCVLLGVPVIAVVIGPLLRRLERAETVYRHQQGVLTTRAGDIVAGLRVLAGVGGRDLFARRYATRSQDLLAEGYRVGAVNSWIDALTLAIPGLFLAAVVWVAARMAATGDITIGQLVAVYGYVAVLVVPVWFLLEGSYQMIRGRVAARRIVALLNLTPDHVDGRTAPDDVPGSKPSGVRGRSRPGGVRGRTPGGVRGRSVDDAGGPPGDRPAPTGPAELRDPASGLVVHHGRLVAVAADDPADASALADRLGRFVVSEVIWGGVPLTRIALAEVRGRILVADHDSYLFAGTLREILRVRKGLGDDEFRAALRVASAEDVVDALPEGLGTPIDARARRLSGGQRQRVRLARALLAEPEVLILVDPTSAVDAHTEARIAERIRTARAGRTTIVLATSPLLLGRADTVAHLRDGRIVATGTRAELLDRDPGYRALVSREEEPDPGAETGGFDGSTEFAPVDVEGSLR